MSFSDLLGPGHYLAPWTAPVSAPTAGVCDCAALEVTVEAVVAVGDVATDDGLNWVHEYLTARASGTPYGRVITFIAAGSADGTLAEVTTTLDPATGAVSAEIGPDFPDDGREHTSTIITPATDDDVRTARDAALAVASSFLGASPWGMLFFWQDAVLAGSEEDLAATKASRLADLATQLTAATASATASAAAEAAARVAWLAGRAANAARQTGIDAAQTALDAARVALAGANRALVAVDARVPLVTADHAAAVVEVAARQSTVDTAAAALVTAQAVAQANEFALAETYRAAARTAAGDALYVEQTSYEITVESSWDYVRYVPGGIHETVGVVMVPKFDTAAAIQHQILASQELVASQVCRYRLRSAVPVGQPMGDYAIPAAVRTTHQEAASGYTPAYVFPASTVDLTETLTAVAASPVSPLDVLLIGAEHAADPADLDEGEVLLITSTDAALRPSDNALHVTTRSIAAFARKSGFRGYVPPDGVSDPRTFFARETASGAGFSGYQQLTVGDPSPITPAGIRFQLPSTVALTFSEGVYGRESHLPGPGPTPGITGQTATTRTFADGLTLTLSEEITTESLRSWADEYVDGADDTTSENVTGSLPARRQLADDETSYLRSRMWLLFAPTWSAPRPGPITVDYPYRLLRVDLATDERTVLERTLSVTFGPNTSPTPVPVEVVAEEGEMILNLDSPPTEDDRVWNADAPTCMAAGA